MEGNYRVTFGNQQVGKVQLRRQGLYYCICCRCQLTGDMVCRLQVSCAGKKERLGILVPMGDGFGLDTKIPVKRIGEGDMTFSLVPNHEKISAAFYPISPEEPFAYIARLKNAYLVRKNGEIGVII